MIDFSILVNYFPYYIEGFLNTILASVLALIGSFVLGSILAVFRITGVKLLQWIGTAYVEFVRNIPLLLIVFFFWYALPTFGMRLDGFQAGTVGLTIYTAAFIAEAIRAGILSVPKGQMEAARSSGMTYVQAMLHVVLPQAIKLVIPPLSNQFINLIKNSSVLTVVAGLDLMYFADKVNGDSYATVSAYVFAGLFYLVLTLPMSYGSHVLERRLAKSS